jgi:hypothetical protein
LKIPYIKTIMAKFTSAWVILLFSISNVSAGINTPQLSISLQNGNYGGLEGLDPSLSWSSSASAIGCDFEAGLETGVRPTLDIASLPKSIWGKIRRDIAGGWGVSARGKVSLDGSGSGGYSIEAASSDADASLVLSGAKDGLRTVSVNKGLDLLGGSLSINPRYDIPSSSADVTLGYDSNGTSVTVKASGSAQSLTVSQQVTDNDTLIPSINSAGEVTLGWKRNISADSAITTTLKPNDSINIKWEDGSWTAVIDTPLEGYSTGDVSIGIKRKVDLL